MDVSVLNELKSRRGAGAHCIDLKGVLKDVKAR